MDRPIRTFRGKIKFGMNKLIKYCLMALPVLCAIIIIIYAAYNGVTYRLWGGITGAFTFLNVFYTIVFFFDPKYFTERRKRYLPFWGFSGVVGMFGCFMLLTYGNITIVAVGPLLLVSLFGGWLKIWYTKRKYLNVD